MEQARLIDGAHLKNLFLRNKKGKMWLLVTPEDPLRFLDAEGHTPQIVSFDTPG